MVALVISYFEPCRGCYTHFTDVGTEAQTDRGKMYLTLRPSDTKSYDPSIHPESLVSVHQKLPKSSFLSSLISDSAPPRSSCSSIPLPCTRAWPHDKNNLSGKTSWIPVYILERKQALEYDSLGSKTGSATCQLCVSEQVSQPLRASVFLFAKWRLYYQA